MITPQRIAVVVALLLATILTISVALNLRYKPMHLDGAETGTSGLYAYVDSWTGTQVYCEPLGGTTLCIRGATVRRAQ